MLKAPRRQLIGLLFPACLTLFLPFSADAKLAFQVVVREDLGVSSLECKDLSRMFLRKKKTWPGGSSPMVVPIDRPEGSPLFTAFAESVHCREASTILSYWHRMLFSGREMPPERLAADEDVFRTLLAEPGAVAYVDAETPLPPGLERLAVGPCECESFADAGDAGPRNTLTEQRTPARQDTLSRKEILAQQGDLRLFLTGDCEHGGRLAILQNRSSHRSLSAVIERSQWVRGSRRSSNTRTVTVPALGEQQLGCTAAGSKVELRYAIASTSDARRGEDLIAFDERPARDLIKLVQGRTCGRGGDGRELSLINQHGWRSIAVKVEIQRLVDNRLKQSYRKTHLLAPGARKDFGCGLDGNVEKRVQMIDVEYR